MKILTIFTGGTIGCSSFDGVLSPDKANSYLLLNTYLKSHTGVDFTPAQPYTILSENLNGNNLTDLYNCISSYNLDDFDSFASFFTRQNLSLKPVLAKNIFISPAQAKLSVYKITKGQTITIKNSQYSIEDLIGDSGGSYSCRIARVCEKLSRQPGLNSFMCHIVRDGRNVFYRECFLRVF